MQLITTDEARTIVTGFKDGLGKTVDLKIVEALTQFTRVTEALGFKTFQSCEGHMDWGFPFPWIDFEVTSEKLPLPSLLKVWKLSKRKNIQRENKKHADNTERKTDQLCFMLTRYLIHHDQVHGTRPEMVLVIKKRGSSWFRLLPAHHLLSEAYKSSRDYNSLNTLLEEQRAIFSSFASFLVRMLEREENLIGVPDEGCRGCMGRG